MGVRWEPPRSVSLRPVSPPVARGRHFRLLARGFARCFPGRSPREPVLSPLADALARFGELHESRPMASGPPKVGSSAALIDAGSASCEAAPDPSGVLLPASSSSGSRRASRLLAAPDPRRDPVLYDGRRWL
jgi:hypothetical protein